MKKTLLSLGILGILFLGSGNVFAAPMQKHMKNPPRIEKHQPAPKQVKHQPVQKTVIVQRNHVAPAPRHVAPPPPPKHHHVVHHPQPVVIAQQPYYNYNNGFALKIGNFFLSI